ncbi:TPA: hypothetical protein ACYEKW_000938 [Escherichia coli]
MIDIAEELKARVGEFISLREFITRIKLHQPHVSYSQIADFLYLNECAIELPEWVKQGIAGTIKSTHVDFSYRYDSDPTLTELLEVIRKKNSVSIASFALFQNSAEGWPATCFDEYGFRRAELTEFAEKIGVDLFVSLDEITPPDHDVVENDFLNDEQNIEELRVEISLLKEQIRKLESERPILLNKYRDDDPLYLAIEIRNREWANYDPENDRATRGNQGAITTELEKRGFTSRQAASIELVACPIKR